MGADGTKPKAESVRDQSRFPFVSNLTVSTSSGWLLGAAVVPTAYTLPCGLTASREGKLPLVVLCIKRIHSREPFGAYFAVANSEPACGSFGSAIVDKAESTYILPAASTATPTLKALWTGLESQAFHCKCPSASYLRVRDSLSGQPSVTSRHTSSAT